MSNGPLIIFFALALVAALIAALGGQDEVFRTHGMVMAAVLFIATIVAVRMADYRPEAKRAIADDGSGYMDDVVRAGAIATLFWGIAGFLVGVVIAAQLAFPDLNFEPYFNFNRLRPLHTSAVIFAFGGNALIATSFYVVQRTCRARLFGGWLGWFVFWGYQLFIVMAATGYLIGATQSKEYAEPEWYVDLWLTVVWVAYLLAFLGTLWKLSLIHI